MNAPSIKRDNLWQGILVHDSEVPRSTEKYSDDWLPRRPSSPRHEIELSPQTIRQQFEKGQTACDVRALWGRLKLKWLERINVVDFRDYHATVCDAQEEVAQTGEELERIFQGLVRTWKDGTAGYSITARRYAHGSYQALLVLGPGIVPMILRELQERPDWWFEALKVLTKEDPTKPTDNFHAAVKAWINWGKAHKLIT